MDPASTQGAPAPGASPSRLIGRPSSSGPRGGSRWPVSKEKSQNFYYLHVWAKVQSIIQAPGPGAAGEGRRNVRRFLCQARASGGTGRGAGARIVQSRGARAQPPSAGGGMRPRPGAYLSLAGPSRLGLDSPPRPAGGPGRPAGSGRRYLVTVRAGGSHQRGDGGDLGAILLPGLQILQSKQRRVVQTERVGLDRVVEALLEGVVLQLQHEPTRLLPLRLPLLRRLPPAPGEGEGQHRQAPGTAGPPAGPPPAREPRPAGSLEAQSQSASPPALCAGDPRVRGLGWDRLFLLCAGRSPGGNSARRPLAHPGIVASPTTKIVSLRGNKGRACV